MKFAKTRLYERDITGRPLLRLDGFIILGLVFYLLGLSGFLLYKGFLWIWEFISLNLT